MDSIESSEPYGLDDKWATMIKSHYTGSDSSSYYLPKDINYLLDPTYNVYDKMGISGSYDHKFRSFYQYGIDFMYLTELGMAESPNSYYSLGLNVTVNDSLIHGISKLELYYKHQFSPVIFYTSKNENILYGFKIGVKLLKKLTCIIHSRTVFFDNNLDGKTDKITTQGINLNLSF